MNALYRGKRKDNGEWIEGTGVLIDNENNLAWILKYKIDLYNKHGENEYDLNIVPYEVIPETVGQWTGLCDKNGKKIYEGDIVQVHEYMFTEFKVTSTDFVKYENGSFVLNDTYSSDGCNELGNVLSLYDDYKYIIVIGNVHDNLELLKEV
jgi:uncharacterized phage protein (TIGR01671 family)